MLTIWIDQIDSPMSNSIVQDARGTILDESADWQIVAFPFRKFFNVGESNAATIKWDSGVKVMEKLDGSLMIMYHYKGTLMKSGPLEFSLNSNLFR
jgi:tRNA splicing ligase